MKLSEKTLQQEYRYRGKIVNLRVDQALLENGATALREVVEHPGGVCVGALTEKNELLFVRQFRYPYGEVVTELPAGKLERGEDPLEAGKRELLEETGVIGKDYSFWVIYTRRRATAMKLSGFISAVWIPSGRAVRMRVNFWRRSAFRWSRPYSWCWKISCPTQKPRPLF